MSISQSEQLLSFFKALADESRLKIVGLLAQQSRSVEELAAMLSLTAPTISHHLTKLQKAGLVQAQAQQYYNVYSLQTDVLHSMAKRILKTDALSRSLDEGSGVDQDAFSKKVLSTWVKDGQLVGLPSQLKKFDTVVAWVGRRFQPDQRYTEKQVDAILMQVYVRDPDSLRRALIGAKILARKRDGSAYWRTDSTGASAKGFDPDSLPASDHPVPPKPVAAKSHARIAAGPGKVVSK